jgi:uncharacterized protein YdaU (DUF1376 family)
MEPICSFMTAWTSKGALPAEDKRLARVAGITPKEWADSRAVLLDFFRLQDGAYRHKRLDQELVKAGELIEKKRAAGKASAAARAAKPQGNGSSTGVGTGAQQSANQSQSQSQGSVSKETAGKPRSIFDIGVEVLGGSPGSAKSLIGKWRKAHGDIAVQAGLADAERMEISERRSWLIARFAKPANDAAALYASIDRTFAKQSSQESAK